MKVTVIGCGAWGTTLGKILAENGHDVFIWSHDQAISRDINEEYENKKLLPGIVLPENLRAVNTFSEALSGSSLVVLVTASAFFKETLLKIKDFLTPEMLLVSATKGLHEGDDRRMSELIFEVLPDFRSRTAVLSGPNISKEIALGKPAVTVIASENKETAKTIQQLFNRDYFRVYTNNDVVGTEFGGTLKNVIAIVAGIIDGLKLGDNAKSALMVRGILEMSRLAVKLGAQQQTLFGLSGMGDLITTCSSELSRNHYVGEQLAAGKSLKEILGGMTAVAEGVATTRAAYELAQKNKIEMPVTEQLYKLLYENKKIAEAINDLMNRDLKAENH